MDAVFPNKLRAGDEVRVIAPVQSMALISSETKEIANKRFNDLGLKLSFGKHVEEYDEFASTTIESRVEDLHDAFTDKNVKAVLTVIGGFNSNQLLEYIDWNLVRGNPKIFCGYSDVTILNNALLTKAGLVTYSGVHYSSFGQKLYFDYTLDYFKKCLFESTPFNIKPSIQWSDDVWYKNQDARKPIDNNGFLVINEGKKVEGVIIGGNLNTFNLLQGTEYMPSLKNSILFIEDDSESDPEHFDRDLQSLIHQQNFGEVKALVIGRFQRESNMSSELLVKIIKTKRELEKIPVLANVDFGHTDPKITFPIGGIVEVTVRREEQSIRVVRH